MNIRDVARLADVSVSTVSKVINKKDASVSAATREKILRIVKEYNYLPYANVRTPVKGTTLVLGVLVNDTRTQSGKLMGILNECRQWGYGALVYTSGNMQEEEKNMHVLSSFHVDGVIWEKATPYDQGNAALLQSLEVPYASMEYDGSDPDSFGFDYQHLGSCAHLILRKRITKRFCALRRTKVPVPVHSARAYESKCLRPV